MQVANQPATYNGTDSTPKNYGTLPQFKCLSIKCAQSAKNNGTIHQPNIMVPLPFFPILITETKRKKEFGNGANHAQGADELCNTFVSKLIRARWFAHAIVC